MIFSFEHSSSARGQTNENVHECRSKQKDLCARLAFLNSFMAQCYPSYGTALKDLPGTWYRVLYISDLTPPPIHPLHWFWSGGRLARATRAPRAPLGDLPTENGLRVRRS